MKGSRCGQLGSVRSGARDGEAPGMWEGHEQHWLLPRSPGPSEQWGEVRCTVKKGLWQPVGAADPGERCGHP